ncbi:hypothetical protein [Pantoea sp. B65]|uniref:hypothetical protein n=1 Tax=Pantoea sp. B65 TaxID=2813359 RepID=UPI0039B3A0E8
MEIFAVILTFLLGVVAIVGNTWDSSKSGADKLTTSGRWTAVLLLVSVLVSGYSAWDKYDKDQQAEQQKQQLGKIISTEITSSLNEIAEPFRELYIDNSTGDLTTDKKKISFDMLLNEAMLEKAQTTCLARRPKNVISFPDRGNWHEIFRQDISAGNARLSKIVDRYGVSMSSGMLDAINDLQVNGSFSGYANSSALDIPARQAAQADDKDIELQCAIGQPIGAYKQYLTMLKKIASLNQPDKLLK